MDVAREMLRMDVLHVLRNHPEGVNLSFLWSTITKETGRVVQARNFGVRKLKELLDLWADDMEMYNKNGCQYVQAKKTSGRAGNAHGFSRNDYPSDFPLPPMLRRQGESQMSVSGEQSNAATGSSSNEIYVVDDDSDENGENESDETESIGAPTHAFTPDQLEQMRQYLRDKPLPTNGLRIGKLQTQIRRKIGKEIRSHRRLYGAQYVSFLEDNFSDILYLVPKKNGTGDMLAFPKTQKKSPLKGPPMTSVMSSLNWGQPATTSTKSQIPSESFISFDDTDGASEPATTSTNRKIPSESFISFDDTGGANDSIDLTDDGANETSGQTPVMAAVPRPLIVRPTGINSGPHQSSGQSGPSVIGPHQRFGPPMLLNVPFGQGAMNPPIMPGPSFRGEHEMPGFRDEVVDLTVKAVDTKEFERKEVTVQPVFIPPSSTAPARDYIDSIAKECIETLADANEFVTQERVEKLLLQRVNCRSVRQLGFNYIDQIPCVNELNRAICKVNAYIIAFVKMRAICTLHELKEDLREYTPNKQDFASFKVGPLQRFPLIYQQFKFPPDQAEIPEITSFHILEHFRNYLSKTNLWTGRVELEPFMDYLVEVYSADNAYQLGVRIRSLPLAAAVLKKAQRDVASNKRQIQDQFMQRLKDDIDDSFRKFRVTILQTSESGDGLEVRKHYLKMRPELVLAEVMEKYRLLLTVTQNNSNVRLRRLTKAMQLLHTTLEGDPLCRSLFHLTVCMSSTQLEERALALLSRDRDSEEDDDEEEEQEETGKGNKHNRSKPPPRKDALLDSLKKYIERCLNAGSLSLTHLDRIEEKLLEDFDFPAFHQMGYGRFLDFLLKEAKQVLEESSGLVLGTSAGSGDNEMSFKPHQTDLTDFIKQCQGSGHTQSAEIEDALCKQYRVKEVRHLGHGNITRLLSHADKHGRHQPGNNFSVYYESALIPASGVSSAATSKVGILGHQTRDAAKICLHNCPLLENLADWSQWTLVFEPELGKLKDFIEKHGGVTNKTMEGSRLATMDFLALEVAPGQLVKVVSTTSAEHVAAALESRDVINTSGHLVSMAVAYKGVGNMPMALLAGHVKTALLQMHAGESVTDLPGAPPSPSQQHTAAQFVLQCLLRMPVGVCVALANQVLLDPLGQVVGSTKSKGLLVQLCSSSRELNHLLELGCLLGVREWTDMIQQKCVLPESAVQILPPEVEEYFDGDNQEQEEEDAEKTEDDSDDEDVDDILEGTIDVDAADVATADGTEWEVKPGTSQSTPGLQKDEDSVQIIEDGDGTVSTDDDVMVVETSSSDVDLVTVKTCEDIVNQIRKDEFGIGIHLSEDGQRLMKVQQERLGRSLDRLSKDLYSKDTHFVLELIQNADDNRYHDDLLKNAADGCPTVKFVINCEGITVLNNELGFQEQDIRALCDVGRSTKGKHKFGYIGQKGIGFKSVFRVTDAPEVHSNGFHIQFDVKSGPMGYILPHWVPETDQSNADWMTTISLRLKPDMRLQTRTLAARFNDIHPSLLLFLHRLRQITIENKVEGSVQMMRRRDLGNQVVSIEHSNGSERWLVIRKVLDASKISIQAKSGADVESTEIALAFPLKPPGQKANLQVMPPKQPVFAFLPLRSYGFRFIVQGDFDVPSSREDVDRDSSWNQWLRNEIHTLFIEVLETFKNHSEFSLMEAVVTFLQFVPMEDEVLDFFKPVASDILKKLKAKPCVPIQPNSQGVMGWKMPSQTVRVRDPLVRTVITADLLQKHLNLFYLHSDLAVMLNPTLTLCLGIETLTSDHLLQLGKALIVQMGTHCSLEDVVLVAKWLACMYRSLDEFHDDSSILTALKSLRMLPLSNGELVSVQEKTVFHPLPADDTSKQSKKDPLHHLQQDVNSLHPALLQTEDEEVNSQVHKLLIRLGIKQLSPFDVINHHIIPVLKSDVWQNKSRGTMISYIVYIKEQTEKQVSVCNLEELRDIAQLVTSIGIKNPSQEPVHFPPQYGNSVNLTKVFPGYDWTLLDPCYLPTHAAQADVVSWHDFFSKLAVEDCLSVRQKDVHLTVQTLGQSPWRSVSDIWPKGEPEYVVRDWTSVELDGLINHNTCDDKLEYETQMRQLCMYIDKNWDGKFSRYTVTSVVDSNGKVLKETDTSISLMLRTAEWLPAVKRRSVPGIDGTVQEEIKVLMKQPGCLYVRSEVIMKLLAEKVLYLDVEISKGSFPQFLGLKHSVTIETVMKYLLEWGERKDSDSRAVFCTTLEHMKNVYVYLGKELKRQEFQDLLREKPIFFIPDTSGKVHIDNNQIVSGKMLKRNEIWLTDKTGLFDKYRALLEEFHLEVCQKRTILSFYSDRQSLLELFKQEGRLDPQPQVEEYVELLVLLCNTNTPKDVRVMPDVLYIFSTIGQILSLPPEGMPDEQTANMALNTLKTKLKKKIKNQKVLPTKKLTWVSLEDHPMIADNREWEKMFAVKDGVHFLDFDDKQNTMKRGRGCPQKGNRFRGIETRVQPEMIDMFIEVCEIKRLSQCVSITPTPDMIEPCLQLQGYFHSIIPVVQQYLMARFEDVYQQLELMNTRGMLNDAKFYQTGKLEVTYRLEGLKTDTFEVREEKCVIHPPTFYFHRNHLASTGEINREVARYFSHGNTDCNTALRSFLSELSNIISGSTNDVVEDLLMRHEADWFGPSPEDAWQVEPPPEPEPEPEQEPEYEPEPEPVPYIKGMSASGTNQEPGVMRAWPPVASDSSTPREKQDRPASNIWPPPKAKEYMQSVKSLPSNIKLSGPVEAPASEKSSGGGAGGGTGTGVGGWGGRAKTPGGGDKTEAAGDRPELGGASVAQCADEGSEGSANENPRKRKSDEAVDEVEAKKPLTGEPGLGGVHATGYTGEPGGQGSGVPDGQSVGSSEEQSGTSAGQHGQAFGTHDGTTSTAQHDGQVPTETNFGPVHRPHFTGKRGDPIWTQMATNYTFDDLGRGRELPLATSLTLSDTAGDSEIGRWGEALVAEYLTKQKLAGNIVNFFWRNADEETGCPYDFEVHFADEHGMHVDYIEVKSTALDDKAVFEVSVQQIKFADEKKGNFHIYRVFNAGDSERVRLIRIYDLDMRLSQKQVKLCMLI